MNEYEEQQYEEQQYTEHSVGVVIFGEDTVKELEHLKELKEQMNHLKSVIETKTAEFVAAHPEGGIYADNDGFQVKVTIRHDRNAPKVNLPLLQQIDPELAGKIVKFAVDTDKVNEFIDRGYFTDTPAAQALTISFKKPWIQMSTATRIKESAYDE